MCPPDLSSLKWGEDGELSANDTLLLVERLSRAEQKANSSDKKRLNLSSLNNDSDEVVASWVALSRFFGERAVSSKKTVFLAPTQGKASTFTVHHRHPKCATEPIWPVVGLRSSFVGPFLVVAKIRLWIVAAHKRDHRPASWLTQEGTGSHQQKDSLRHQQTLQEDWSKYCYLSM